MRIKFLSTDWYSFTYLAADWKMVLRFFFRSWGRAELARRRDKHVSLHIGSSRRFKQVVGLEREQQQIA
jgi:hypothetical protein